MRHFLLLSIVLSVPAVALAQAYRWVDDQGQVHYTQTPPPKKEATLVAPPPPPSASSNQDALNQTAAKDQKEAPKKAADAAAAQDAAAKQEADCKNIRDQLAQLEIAGSARRMSTKDENGSVTRWTPEQYEQQKQAFKIYLQNKCGG